MKTAGDLETVATARLIEGDHVGALHLFGLLCRLQPTHLSARLRVGDALLAMNEVQRAAEVYTSLARHASNGGHPYMALIALKILTAMEPLLSPALKQLANLYGQDSARLGRGARWSLGDPDQPLPDDLDISNTPPRDPLIDQCHGEAMSYARISMYPEKLPAIPLFSQLLADAFAEVLSALKLVRARPGTVIIEQGSVGTSFFIVGRGEVEVVRKDANGEQSLAKLGAGAIFGEMALVSDAPRAAEVRASTDCDLLEFEESSIDEAGAHAQTIHDALSRFATERLLHNLMNTSPLFSPLNEEQRLDLARRFTQVEVPIGTSVINEGDTGRGLFIVVRGKIEVSKIEEGARLLLASLRPGEIFGEMALVRGAPTSATCTAALPSTLLFLNRDYFQKLIEAIPAIRTYVENLDAERAMDTSILLSAPVMTLDDEDLVVL